MKSVLALVLFAASGPIRAETTPLPNSEDPRLQTLVEHPGEPARLVAFPEGSLTLIMRQGERVERVVLSDSSAFHIVLTGDDDSISITPLRAEAAAKMAVETNNGHHDFDLETGRGLAAAYVVRLVVQAPTLPSDAQADLPPNLDTMAGRYRLTGDRSLQPQRIADDGAKTYVEWDAGQSIPAVLGIGPTGEEEVVPGYMRRGLFTIDRVYPQLVFRIDRHQTLATRETEGRKP